MLFVHDHQPDFRELHRLFQQCMGADNQMSVALSDMPPDFALAVLLERPGQQDNPIASVFQDSSRIPVVLLRQDFGGSHQRHLVTVLDGNDRGFESDNRFAGTHISLQQSPHGIRLLHVGGNFLEHVFLRVRRMKGQDFLDSLSRAVVEHKGDAGLGLHLPPFEFQPQFQKEQLFKD